MPLIKSKSPEAFKSNLKAEIKAGKPRDQALAIAYRVQRDAKAAGGSVGAPPFRGRSETHSLERSGYINGNTAGRADKVPAAVRANSFVIPADVVSGIGQGNSIAGAHALNSMLKMGPFSTQKPRMSMRRGRFADGGVIDEPITDIKISDGEFAIPPDKVEEIGGGDIDRGHAVLNEFVKEMRRRTLKTLKNLPGPKNS